MKKHRDIFKDTSLSKDELANYLSGNLSQQEKIALEKKIAASDFSTDALEGFENTPESITAFQELSDDFHANLTRKVKKAKWKFQYTFSLIVFIAIAMYGVGHFFLLESERKREAFDERRKQEKNQIAQEKEIEIFEENNIPPVLELTDGEIVEILDGEEEYNLVPLVAALIA